MNDEDLLFAEEVGEEDTDSHSSFLPWKILVVDDEPSVHEATRIATTGFTFEDRELEILSAYSGEEAKQLILDHPDTALVLLDVVMEEDDSGLAVSEFIRNEAKNPFVRIVLRTGQPGQAPEKNVIVNYDINDYKEKTELTNKKLFTTLVSSLRAFRHIMTIERNRQGLERIIFSFSSIFQARSMERFVSGVMMQLLSILQLHDYAFYSEGKEDDPSSHHLLSGTGSYEDMIGCKVAEVVEDDVSQGFMQACVQKSNHFAHDHGFIYMATDNGKCCIFHLSGCKNLDETSKNFISLFVSNISVAYLNLVDRRHIEDTQRQISYILGSAVENRSHSPSKHSIRVAKYSKKLALLAGLEEQKAELLELASPLHDLGKVCIPEQILNKPGPLSKEEFEIVKQHSEMGHALLSTPISEDMKTTPVLRVAATIAWQHREHWDGKGYPEGLVGEDIHIFARITAIADVFDALASCRSYKEAWPIDKITSYFNEQKGHYFDPALIDYFLDHLDGFLAIKEKYRDVASLSS